MSVRVKIQTMRKSCGMTREDLAKLTNYSLSSITKLENGTRNISPEMLIVLKNAMGYTDVPITEEEVVSFRKNLHDIHDAIKHSHLDESREKLNNMQDIITKCFEDEFRILHCLFDSYLLIREYKHGDAKNKLETLTDKIDTFTDKQKYFYHYFYAGSIYKDYRTSIRHFLQAEEIAKKMGKLEVRLYYSLSNIYSRIDYSPKAITYGELALKMAQTSPDKAYLLHIESTVAFGYSRIGCYQLALDGLHECILREKFFENKRELQVAYHNLGCVYFYMEDYINAINYFNKALKCCDVGSWSFLNNKLYIAYILISENKNDKALALIDEVLPFAQNIEDMLLLLQSAKHSLSLNETESLNYIENTTIPQLLEIGSHLEAIKYMNILSNFYRKKSDSKQSNKKLNEYLELALFYTNKILKGEL